MKSVLQIGLWLCLSTLSFFSLFACAENKEKETGKVQVIESVQETGAEALHKEMKTFTYAVKGTDTLELDLYLPQGWNLNSSPVVLFVHGGGFYSGTRKEDNIHHFCDSLSDCGFAVANMSYRLYLKGQSFHCDQPNAEKIMAFQVCVNDIRSATSYLIDQSADYRLDTAAIHLVGSSAGAEAALHAAYWPNATMNLDIQALSNDFKYASISSFAGAIVDTSLITKTSMIPTLMYHGTCDPLVPYASAPHHYCDPSTSGALMLHGSKSIKERLEHLNGDFFLVSTCGAQHGQASYPIVHDIPLVVSFFEAALRGEKMQVHEIRQGSTKPCRYGGTYSECED